MPVACFSEEGPFKQISETINIKAEICVGESLKVHKQKDPPSEGLFVYVKMGTRTER